MNLPQDQELLLLIIPLMVWSLVWKGVALWHAARRGEKPWFIALLVINSVGLLEIAYLALIVRRKPKTTVPMTSA